MLKHGRPSFLGDSFVPNFDIFARTGVNDKKGAQPHMKENPIYTFLKSRCPSVRPGFNDKYKLMYNNFHQDDIRWNYEKFLIDSEGQPVWRYDRKLNPMEIVPDIDQLLDDMDNSYEHSSSEDNSRE